MGEEKMKETKYACAVMRWYYTPTTLQSHSSSFHFSLANKISHTQKKKRTQKHKEYNKSFVRLKINTMAILIYSDINYILPLKCHVELRYLIMVNREKERERETLCFWQFSEWRRRRDSFSCWYRAKNKLTRIISINMRHLINLYGRINFTSTIH